MISAESHRAISENCDFNTIGPLLRGAEALTMPGTHTDADSSSGSSSSSSYSALFDALRAKVVAQLSLGSSTRQRDRDMVCARW
jgi:hypothetical protein